MIASLLAAALATATLLTALGALDSPDANAQAGEGRIEGTITDQQTGLPIGGIEVCAVSFVSEHCSVVPSDSDGTYVIDFVTTANYVLEFTDPDDRYDRACFGPTSCSPPQRIGMVSPDQLSGLDVQLSLTLVPTPTPTTHVSTVPTITPTATTIPVPQPTPTPTTTTVPLPQPTPTVTPTPPLQPGQASIAGTITVLSNAGPVFGARVCAALLLPPVEQCAFTGPDGNYRIDGLPPGNYAVQVTDPSGRFVASCWGTFPCEDPQLLGAGSQQAIAGIDIAMDPLFSASFPSPTPETPDPAGTINGTITVNGTTASGLLVCAIAQSQEGFDACAQTRTDGGYRISGLPTANYLVVVNGDFNNDLSSVCYRDMPFCLYPTYVGVLDPLSRVGIDINVDTSITMDNVFEVFPTPTVQPTPSPTPVVRPTLEPLPDNAWPIPYDDRPNSPWLDVPHFGIDGIGTYGLGTYPFASPAAPIVDHLTGYYGETGRFADDGTVTWGLAADPAVQLQLDPNGLLAGFDVNLEAVSEQGLGLLFIGNIWLRDSPITVDAFGLESDRFIYVADDEDGLAIRCGVRNFCLHQTIERDAHGNVTDFGPALRMTADAGSVDRVRLNGSVTAAQDVGLRAAPDSSAPVVDLLDLSGGITAGVLGSSVTDPSGQEWVLLTADRDPLRRAGWARSELLTAAPTSDLSGVLPRLEQQPADLAALIGATHLDPFTDISADGIEGTLFELLDADFRVGSRISTLSADPDRTLVLTRTPGDLGARTNIVLSEELDGVWTVVDAWSIYLGTEHLNITSGSPQCPFLFDGDDANIAELVITTDFVGEAGWVWINNNFVGVDVSDIVCETYR